MPSSLTVPTIDLERDDDEILPTLERALCDIGFVLVAGHDFIAATVVTKLVAKRDMQVQTQLVLAAADGIWNNR